MSRFFMVHCVDFKKLTNGNYNIVERNKTVNHIAMKCSKSKLWQKPDFPGKVCRMPIAT